MRRLTALGLKALLALSVCFSALTPSLASAEDLVYVDLQRAVFEVEDGKAAKNRLETMKSSRQKALDAKQTELKKLQESFEKQQQFLSAEVKQKKELEFRTKLGELQATYAKLQRELAEEEMKIQQEIFGRMGAILEKIAQDSGYKMIIRKESLLWAPPHLDITNEVIRRYNMGSGAKGKVAPKKGKGKSRAKKRK
jgi:outer membrane protein